MWYVCSGIRDRLKYMNASAKLIQNQVPYFFSKGVSNGISAWGVIRARCLRWPLFQSTKAECCVTRLSQTTTVPSSHLTRAWKSAP